MTEFLKLPLQDQSEILLAKSVELNRTAQVLQKDVWVCWALEHLFKIETHVKMAFKGGTSLSKVYQVIDRFSEDVDVTLDYKDLAPDLNPFEEGLSRTKLKKISTDLQERVREHIKDVLFPVLQSRFDAVTDGVGESGLNEDDQKGIWIELQYPSGLEEKAAYMKDRIIIEFGGRNAITPREPKVVRPYLAETEFQLPLEFPVANVEVLSAERTFWEKATLIHVECQKPNPTKTPERKSRHWYDLHKLLNHEVGQLALKDRGLLKDVVKFKKVFYHTGYANYDACLSGGLELVPKDDLLRELQDDYREMVRSGMFEEPEPPSFDSILESLKKAEDTINH